LVVNRYTANQRELASMLDALATDRAVALTDDTETVTGLVGELAGLGVWTLGTAEAAGGGRADFATTAVAAERLGRSWPALGWASVQAHAAIDVLAGDERAEGLVKDLHAGTTAVAVVDAAAAHVRLGWDGARLSGSIARVDAAHEAPHLLVLDGADAVLVAPAGTATTPIGRTGLGGAFTRSLTVDTVDAMRLFGVPIAAARRRLLTGAAAVATGIAGAAAEAALAYATDRHQFGAALTAIPTVRQTLLDQAARTSVLLDAVLAAGEDDLQTYATARAACDGAVEVAAAALQSHGGYGYLTEYAAERRLRDAVSLRAAADVAGAALRVASEMVQ